MRSKSISELEVLQQGAEKTCQGIQAKPECVERRRAGSCVGRHGNRDRAFIVEMTGALVITQQVLVLVTCCMEVYCLLECHIDIKSLTVSVI